MISLHRLLLLVLVFALTSLPVSAQQERPQLIVQIVVDQLRGDYLLRWQPLFEEGGFKRLTTEGAWFQDCHYPYANTMTGPGHATLSTGCPPRIHGIVTNDWYDRKAAHNVYCAGSERFTQVPPPLQADSSAKEKDKDKAKDKDREKPKVLESGTPQHLLAPTFADALKEQCPGARVVCLSLKDRSSVLPGGKHPDACYWADKHGRFVTSTYYRDKVHPWVEAFNRSGYMDRWHGKQWQRLRLDLDYTKWACCDDFKGEGKGFDQGYSFPHPLDDGEKKQRTNYYGALANSPFGNQALFELARKAIEAENLGSRSTPDFLSISFSSNDLVGHCWGPDSQEVLDITLRCDLLLRDLLDYLDRRVGKGKYLLALSSDHGICPLPEFSRSKGLEARRLDPAPLLKQAEAFLDDQFPLPAGQSPTKSKWIEANKATMLYLNRRKIVDRGLKPDVVEKTLADWLPKQPGIERAFPRADLARHETTDPFLPLVRASYFPERSGDLLLVLKKYHLLTNALTGTTHGTPHDYDTHVPLIVLGPGIKPGAYKQRVSPEHLPVILAHALGIQPPAKATVKLPEGVLAK